MQDTPEVQQALEEWNRRQAPARRLFGFHLLEEPLSIENGLLTPTLKVKRNIAMERFAERYQSAEPYNHVCIDGFLPEIPDNVKEGLTIIPVSHVSEVLEHALVRKPEPIEWDEAAEEAAAAALKAQGSGEGARAH